VSNGARRGAPEASSANEVGAAYGAAVQGPAAHERCPHCGATALVEPSGSLRYACAVCGMARVPVDDPSIARTNAEAPVLERATRAKRAASIWSGIGVGASLFAVAAVGVFAIVLALAHPGVLAITLGAMITLLPILGAVVSFGRAREARAAIEPALDEGWLRAASDALAARGVLTAGELATLTRSPLEQAERQLAALSATGEASADVTGPGELAFRSTRAEPARTRVAPTDVEVPRARLAPTDMEAARTRLAPTLLEPPHRETEGLDEDDAARDETAERMKRIGEHS
jgi:hypothetical protein